MNPHEEVTSRILSQLKAGVTPWVKPWKPVNGAGAAPVGMPHNARSGRPYSGVNVFLLWMELEEHPGWWDRPAFMTFKQALEAGGNVRKGEHGFQVYYMSNYSKKDADDPDAEERSIRFLKRYTVFHVSQCENLTGRLATPADAGVEPLMRDDMAEFYAAVGATTLHGGNSAFYAPGPDRIQMPKLEQFDAEYHYHSTRLHEITHWTGAKHRLERMKGTRFGDASYAFEELVAELGCALLSSELGVTGQLRHAEYIGHWIKLLADHDRAFFSAASQASKAVEFVRDLCLASRTPIAEAAQ